MGSALLFAFAATPSAPAPGATNALACIVAGVALFFAIAGYYPAGSSRAVQWYRYTFGFAAGLAASTICTWGLWAAGVPIDNGTVRRGIMAEHYWLGPAMLAYAVVCWAFYRHAAARDGALN